MTFQIVPEDRANAYAAAWQKKARSQVKVAVDAGAPASMEKIDKSVLSDLPLSVHWGYRLFVHDKGTLISASFGKSEDKEWGRGINVMIVHTLLDHRGQGKAKGAYEALMAYGRKKGYDRLTTTSGSYGGWRTHHALGLTAWGLNGEGQIVFEHPLDGQPRKSPPPRARKLGSRAPLSLADQVKVLIDPEGPYKVSPSSLPADVAHLAG